MKVRFGQVVKGGKPHMIVGTVVSCPVAAVKPLITMLKPSEVNAEDLCYWCRRQDNLAAASRENCYGETGWSRSLERLLLLVEVVRTVKQEWELAIDIAASRQQIDMSWGRSGAVFAAAAVVTPVVEAPRTAFAEAAERMGAKRRQLPTNVTPISSRKRLALAASFAA